MTLNKNRRWNRKVMAAFAVLFAFIPLLVLIPSRPALAADGFAWVDKATIVDTEGSAKTTYSLKAGSSNEYDAPAVSNSSTECNGTPKIVLDSGAVNSGTLTKYGRPNNPSGGVLPCQAMTSSVTIGNTSGATKTPVATDPTGTTSNSNNQPGCESGAGALAWIMCPIIEGISKAVDGIFSDFIQPMLQTNPLNLSPSSGQFKAWSDFRVLGDIFLVMAVLVIVFSETIGGGTLDAYTIKKIIPRLLIAVIAINLSYYLVALAVDITNIIGGGIIALIEEPFKNAGTFHVVLSGTGTYGLAIGAAVGSTFAVAGGAPLMVYLWTFVLVPLILTMIAVMVTIIVRMGLIIFLVIISPVAFALYCLPNTEQYFRKWWDLLFKTLLVYPIISALFGIAYVLSTTIGSSLDASNPLIKATGTFIQVFALILPLFLIPFSFRFAGGAIGKLHETLAQARTKAHESYKGNPNDPNSRQNRARTALNDRNVINRERAVSRVAGWQKSDNKFVRAAGRHGPARWGAAVLNAGDLEAQRSALTKKQADTRELKTGYGPDDSVRAFFAKKVTDKADKDYGKWRSTVDPSKTFSDIDRQKAVSLYGKSGGLSAAQSAVNYELGKTANDDQYANFMQSAPQRLKEQGFNDGEISSVMKGVGYANQAKRLDLKHSGFKQNDDGSWKQSVDHATFAQDAAENFGSYPISMMKTSPIKQLGKSYDAAQSAIRTEDAIRERGRLNGTPAEDINKAVATSYTDLGFKADPGVPGGSRPVSARQKAERTITDVQRTATILDSRMRVDPGRSGAQPVGETEDHQPIYADGRTGAPGRVNEEIQNLVQKVNPAPTGRNAFPGGGSGGGSGGGGRGPSGPAPGGGSGGGSGGGGPQPPQPAPWTPPRRPQGPSGGGGSPQRPRIIVPGDDDFNTPPGSLPPGR